MVSSIMNNELLKRIQWFLYRVTCAENYRKIYKYFCDHEDIQKKLFSVSPGFYIYISRVLQHSVMIELARVFEGGRQNYDINKLLKDIEISEESFSNTISGELFDLNAVVKDYRDALSERKTVIDNLKAQRDKIWMHIDKDYVLNPSQAEKDYPISWGAVEDLINITELFLRQIEYGINGERTAMSFF